MPPMTDAELLGAAHLIDRFVDSPAPTQKPRARKPKVTAPEPALASV